MGKGDKKSRRGKIIIGTFGVRRPKKTKQNTAPEIKMAVSETPKPDKRIAKEKSPVRETKSKKVISEIKSEPKTQAPAKKRKGEQ